MIVVAILNESGTWQYYCQHQGLVSITGRQGSKVGRNDAMSDWDGDDEGMSRSSIRVPTVAPMEVDDGEIDLVTRLKKKKSVSKVKSKA
jgi:hypothetical protein